MYADIVFCKNSLWDMDICWVRYKDDLKEIDGGNVYSRAAIDVLSRHFFLEFVDTCTGAGKMGFIRDIYKLCRLNQKKDVFIRDFWSTITMPLDSTSGKDVLLIYHIDSSVSKYSAYLRLMERLFYRSLGNLDVVVTISEYWKKKFEELGCKDVRVIPFGMDPSKFSFTDEEILSFKSRFGLVNKPIIYIGNCQRAKGVVEVYDALKGMDVHLVTSGRRLVEIPAINLDIGYGDYLRLLKASLVVVTMSKFTEGWGITPHEAMLCRTPVIGSGLGGMGELLDGGKQVICRDFRALRGEVEAILNDPRLAVRMGDDGFKYASQYTLERFQSSWIELMRGLQ